MKLPNRMSVGVLAYLIEKDTSQDHVFLLREDFVMQTIDKHIKAAQDRADGKLRLQWWLNNLKMELQKAEPFSPDEEEKVTR